MTHSEKRKYLIKGLLSEFPQYNDLVIPDNEEAQKRLLRSLMNIRPPRPIGEEFLNIQDEYLSGCGQRGYRQCHAACVVHGQPSGAVAGRYYDAED